MATTISTGTNPYKLGSPPDFGTLYSGRALEFDGVTDYVSFDVLDIDLSETWTLSAWVNSNDATSGTFQTIIGNSKDGSNRIGLQILSSNAIMSTYNGSGYTGKSGAVSSSQWHHIVGTLDNTSLELYIDAVTQTGDTTGSFSSADGKIGVKSSGNSLFFNGKMSNLQIWDKVWSLSDVQYAYTHPEKLITDNSAVTSGTTISNLKAWYPMTEGTGSIVYDGSGNDNHGTNAVGADYITAQSEPLIPQTALMGMSKPMVFDGSDDYVDVGDIALTDFSIGAWIKQDVISYNVIVGDTSNADWLRINSATSLTLKANNGTSVITHGLTFTVNEWQYLTVTREGSTINVYRNGVVGGTHGSLSNTFTPEVIGQKNSNSYFEGIINEVSIFNTALNLSEVQELFNDGVALDATTHSKSGNLVGYWRNDGASKWLDRSISENLVLDGDDDYVNCPNIDLSGGEGTITAWFNHSEADTQTIFAYGGNGDDISVASRGSVHDLAMTDGINNVGDYETGGSFLLNTWNHVALTVASSGVKYVYLNGSAVISDTGPNNSFNFSDIGNNTLMIGKQGAGGGTFFNGIVDQVAVWDTVLTSANITSIYNAGRSVADVRTILSSLTGNLQAYYQFETENLLTATTVVDLSGNGNTATLTSGATISGDNDGIVSGTSPDTILLPEGTTSGKDLLGFPLTHTNNGWLNLSGSEYVEIADNDILDANSEITLEAWVRYFDSPSPDMYIFNNYVTNGYRLRIKNGNFDFYLNNGENVYSDNNIVSLSKNTWHHLTLSIGNGYIKAYLNGDVVMTQNYITEGTFNNTESLFIGQEGEGDYFNGQIDEVKIYNRALSAPEITKNYKHGKSKHS